MCKMFQAKQNKRQKNQKFGQKQLGKSAIFLVMVDKEPEWFTAQDFLQKGYRNRKFLFPSRKPANLFARSRENTAVSQRIFTVS